MRKLRSIAPLVVAAGLGPAACVADPMTPCDAFDAGRAADNVLLRSKQGVVAAIAMKDGDGQAFVLRNLCDGPDGECHVDKLPLPELSPGSQVLLTTAGHFLVGIDRDDGRVWTYQFDDAGEPVSEQQTYIHQTDGPAQLIIGLRDSDALVVRDLGNRLALYLPGDYKAQPIAPALGPTVRLAAVGDRHVAVRVPHSEHEQSLYLVDLGEEGSQPRNPGTPLPIATGDFSSVVFGPGDATLVISEGHGTEASVLVFDVEARVLADAFEGELVSSRRDNQHRSLEEVPGLRAVSPGGEQIAYRTTSGALAVRQLGSQSSCLVRNTNRLGTAREPARNVGDHVVAGFSADGIVFAEYTVGLGQSYVYAYEPRQQQLVPLGAEDGGWHLSAVPGRVTTPDGEVGHLWAVGVHEGQHATIGEGRVNGETVGQELTFIPRADEGIWAIDTNDRVDGLRRERALSLRRVAPPRFEHGQLRFEQGPDEQVVDHYVGEDLQGPLRVPLSGRLCLTTGVPGAWAYRCGDSTGTGAAITTSSGRQEQINDPNVVPEYDPPFPEDDEDDDEPS